MKTRLNSQGEVLSGSVNFNTIIVVYFSSSGTLKLLNALTRARKITNFKDLVYNFIMPVFLTLHYIKQSNNLHNNSLTRIHKVFSASNSQAIRRYLQSMSKNMTWLEASGFSPFACNCYTAALQNLIIFIDYLD
jgi:hypothetical protein